MRQRIERTSKVTSSQPDDKIRVFLLEDYPGALKIFAQTLATTSDLVYADGHTRNSPDLPALVRQAKAGVVVVDLLLTPIANIEKARRNPETWGGAAIEALRHYYGHGIKLVAWSNWPHLRQEALAAGADVFLHKYVSVEFLFDVIRQVMGQKMSSPPQCNGKL